LDDPLIWVRAIHFGATMLVMGGVIFDAFIAAPAFRATAAPVGARVRSRLAVLAWVGLAVTVLSGAAWLVLLSERMSDLSFAEVFAQGTLWTVLSETDFGVDWGVRLVLAGLLAAVWAWGRVSHSYHRRSGAIAVAAGLVGTLAWAGHAAASAGLDGAVHLTADILHLIAAAAWFGSLIPLALLLRAARGVPEESAVAAARTAVLRFSQLGIASVVTLAATGLVNTWVLAGSLTALVATDYGRLLMLKVALFLVMLLFAAINRLWLTPRLVHAPTAAVATDALRRIERNSLIEAGLGTIIIAIVGLLGTLPPGLEDAPIVDIARICWCVPGCGLEHFPMRLRHSPSPGDDE
jgi:putative copper resistance protein D